jgi:hypothetical protein
VARSLALYRKAGFMAFVNVWASDAILNPLDGSRLSAALGPPVKNRLDHKDQTGVFSKFSFSTPHKRMLHIT